MSTIFNKKLKIKPPKFSRSELLKSPQNLLFKLSEQNFHLTKTK